MLTTFNMPESLRITLKYSGPSVDDGTMPLDDVVEALQGFAGAYGKVAVRFNPEAEHQLRVSALETNSFELVILAWLAVLHTASTDLESLKPVSDAARWVYGILKGVINVKKHTAGKKYDVAIKGDSNTVVVVNAEGAGLVVTPEVLETFQSRQLDHDLNKIAAPLSPESVRFAELSASGDPEPVRIESEEREAFSTEEAGITTIETNIVGKFVSLNKERNRGSFKLGNGNNVPYHYTGDNPERMHLDFSYSGSVRIRCAATLSENLEPLSLEIKSVERLQRELPLSPPSSPE